MRFFGSAPLWMTQFYKGAWLKNKFAGIKNWFKVVGLKQDLQADQDIKTQKITPCALLICILLLIFIIVIFSFCITKKEYITNQNHIQKISNNTLDYVGKLKYIRENYNAVSIDKTKIFIIGKGNNDISKKAEIFDIEKKKKRKNYKFN